MNDPEHFLSRWSRKKRDESDQDKRSARQDAATPPPVNSAAAPDPDEMPRKPPAAAQSTASPPAFDPASLPSIESIGAETDITGFLKPGVPSELRHAALRRAWSVDPAIRDFKGLQENDWNFNDPNGIPGFGPLSPDIDVKRMAAALFGGSPKAEPADQSGRADPQTAAAKDNSAGDSERGATMSARESLGDGPAREISPGQDISRREEDIAAQNKRQESDSAPQKPRRSRGGALPQS
jgi:hypothetical protein